MPLLFASVRAASFATLRQAARRLRRSPGYSLSVIAVLALGVGAVTAIFSVVYGVLLKPYGFEQKGQLVVWHETVREMSATTPVLPANYRHYLYLSARSKTMEHSAVLQPSSFSVGKAGDHAVILPGIESSPDFFRVLGVAPVLGRQFLPTEFTQGRNAEVILSWDAFQTLLHGDPSAVGRPLRIDGSPQTVVGVLPASFRFPAIYFGASQRPTNKVAYGVYVPMVVSAERLTETTGDYDYFALARLRPGISIAAAQAELDGLEKAEAQADRLSLHLGAVVQPFSEEVTGSVSSSLLLLLVAVGGVLLIGCVNLANLQLARSVGQAGEHALRLALGATRWQIVGEVLAENLLLALAGTFGAILVAFSSLRLLLALAPAGLPRLDEVRINLPVLLTALVVALATSLLFGLLPALRAGRADPMRALGSSTSRLTGETSSAARARQALLVAEIAAALVLLTVTGLVTRSFSSLLTSARGVSSVPVTMAEVSLSDSRYQGQKSSDADYDQTDPQGAARIATIGQALDKLRSLPGVQAVGMTDRVPLAGETEIDSIRRPDHPLPEGEAPEANRRRISPGYFTALGIPITDGRDFTEADRANPRVAIVSESAAHAAWGLQSPVGHTITTYDRTYTVVGVAADSRLADPRHNTAMFYLPFWDAPPGLPVFLIRDARGASIDGAEIRQAIWSVDPEVAIPELLPLHVQTARALALERFQTLLIGCFGSAALLLAALGVYGVLSYGVNLRMREWALRMALGSSRLRLVRRVLLYALRPLLAGGVLGLGGALLAERWLGSLLYQANTQGHGASAAILAGALALLGAVVLLAALPSAQRAARAEPAAILRAE